MAPKRQRASTLQSAPQFDDTRFVSVARELRYHRVIANKNLVSKRGLRPDLRQDGEMATMITERRWSHLTRQLDPTVISLVREFYANAVSIEADYVVQVRGKAVAYDRKTINNYYQLPNYEYEDYLRNGLGAHDLNIVIAQLYKPGTTWKLRNGTDEKTSFSYTELSCYKKAWYSFICSNLMPTRHISDVTKEKAVLLFAIVTKLKIDIRLVI